MAQPNTIEPDTTPAMTTPEDADAPEAPHDGAPPHDGSAPHDEGAAAGWRALVPGATLRVDAGGRLIDVAAGEDARLARLARRAGRSLTEVMRASDRVVWLHALSRVRTGAPQRLRLALCPPADGRSWLDVTARLSLDPDGEDGPVVLASLHVDAIEAPASAPVQPLAELAHELRTPLNAVRGYAQALEAGLFGDLNTRQRDAVGGIAQAGEHLIELANAVLDGARLKECEALDRAAADPADAVARGCAILRGTAERAGVTLANRVMPGEAVPHDAAALRQIVVNLVSNAIKASPPGSVVGLDARRNDDALLIAVRDAGPGIPTPVARGTGAAWSRGIAARGEATGGMGLPLVRRLCALHGGTLRFEERDPQNASTASAAWRS